MKKFFLVLMMCLLTQCSVFAEGTLKVMAVTPISTKTPSENITVQALEDKSIGSLNISKGYVLYGKMIDVVAPRRMGKNACFSIKLISYDDLRGKNHLLQNQIILPYRQQMRPNYRRSSITVGSEAGSGFTFSPYDIDLAKESTGVLDFLKKEAIKDSIFDTGWEIELKKDDIFRFNIKDL